MNKIYLVVCHTGDWEDRQENSIAAFPNEASAIIFKEEQESKRLIYDPYYDKLLERIASYAQSVADRKGLNPDYEDYWDVVDSVEEPLKAKAKKKYPRFTNSPWEESFNLYVESVPFYGSFNFNLDGGNAPVEE